MLPWHHLLPATTGSAAETERLGAMLAPALAPGAIVALQGDLGAGKTHLVKGMAKAWGIDPALVSSPTFTLVNEYAGTRFPVYHFDAYRIRTAAEFEELGYEEYFFGDGICLVEWPERVDELLPRETIRLHLSHAGDNRRRVQQVSEFYGDMVQGVPKA